MADKSDDIKQLFSHLGLNPNDYHEIRSAPTANATVSEVPRRWSLLQAAAAPRSVQPVMPQALLTAVAPVPVPAPPAAMSQSLLPAALLAAAEDILRAEATGGSSLRRPALAEQAPRREPAMIEPAADLGLQSRFQSVKEPQTAAYVPPLRGEPVRPSERRTEMILDTPPPVLAEPAMRGLSFAERAAPLPKPVASALPAAIADEPETRYAPPPSRLGPVPMPPIAPVIAVAPTPTPTPAPLAPAAPGSGRLRFVTNVREPAASNGESLQDVFRRLSRDNRA